MKYALINRIDNNNKEDLNPRWQISISVSDGQFQQVLINIHVSYK